MHVRVDGVGCRHDEHAWPRVAHLVLIQPHRGEPILPGELREVLALLLREHVHVAIAVVPDIRMIEVRQRALLEGGALVLVEPVGDGDLAVRIRARHQEHDDVVQDLPGGRRVVGREAVDELEGHLRRADLGAMYAAGDEQHDLALPEDLVPLTRRRGAVLEVEPPLDLLVSIEVADRVRRADLQREKRLAAARASELAEADPVGARRRVLHVVDDGVPAGQLSVRADPEADKLFRRLD